MQVPLETSFRDLTDAEVAEAKEIINEQATKLDRFGRSIILCRIAVDRPQSSQRSGNPFRVHIRVTVPPQEDLNVNHEPTDNDAHATLGAVIRHAFQAMTRQLKRHEEVQRGEVKHHAGTPPQPKPYLARKLSV